MRLHILVMVILVGLLLAAPLAAISPYDVITPGGAYDVAPRLSIPDAFRQQAGRMAFTAVYEQDATWSQVILSKLVPLAESFPPGSGPAHALRSISGTSEAVPRALIRPPGVSQEQLNQANKQAIDESKPVAAVVALRAAGFDASITGTGAEVQSIVAGLPADGTLAVGDVIVAVDEQPIHTSADLTTAIRRHHPGDTVHIGFQRGGQNLQQDVVTRESPSETGVPIVGVTISTHGFDVHLPFPVNVDSGDIGGPSAGLMFALSILDSVTPGDLTRGYYVAGTGTIDVTGAVGAIGGVAEKVAAAEDAGAQVFIVPRDNYADALRAVRAIQLIPAGSFDEAVHVLCALPPAPGTPTDPPAPCPS